MSKAIHVLFVDDDDSLREITTMQLEGAGFRVTACGGGADAIARFEVDRADVVVTDLKMPGVDGMQVLTAIRRLDRDVPILVSTAFGSVDTAVAAMQAGAYDYVTKPVAREALVLKVRRAAALHRVIRENRNLRSQVEASGRRPMLVVSPQMTRLMDQVRRVGPSGLPVLLMGESGTGKELVARDLHRQSERADGPFVAVNCAAIPPDLLEAALFGHTRGAFTGAAKAREGRFRAASGGTLLLDEIGDLPLALQPKLLRVLQERTVEPIGAEAPIPVDVRIVAATHRDLAACVAEGSFREDLYYRLAVLPLDVPALRQRPDDIVPLFELFLAEQARASGRTLSVSPAAAQELLRQPWPGNVRQLENVARRVALLAPGPAIQPADLPVGGSAIPPAPAAGEPPPSDPGVLTVRVDTDPWELSLPKDGLPLPELERRLVEEAIRRHGGNKSAAARYLRIPRHVLLYRLEKYGIDADALR